MMMLFTFLPNVLFLPHGKINLHLMIFCLFFEGAGIEVLLLKNLIVKHVDLKNDLNFRHGWPLVSDCIYIFIRK